MKSHIDLLNKLLFYGFLLLGAIKLFFNTAPVLNIFHPFISFFSSWFFSWYLAFKGIKNEKYMLFINIALWLNILGEFALYYNGYVLYYDKVLHFSLGIIIAAIVYDYYTKTLGPKKDAVFFTVLGLLAIWEIYEYALMNFMGFPLMGVTSQGAIIQSAIDDTMMDLIFGSIGAGIYLIFRKEQIYRKTIHQVKKIKKSGIRILKKNKR